MSMEKAVISLQKFLDNDCGCEGDSLMQNARTKEQQQAGETKRAGGEGFGVDPKLLILTMSLVRNNMLLNKRLV